MTEEELKRLNGFEHPILRGDMLKNKTPRTLIIGLLRDGQEFHVYLDEDAKINILYYRVDMLMKHLKEPFENEPTFSNAWFNPSDGAIPAQCDFEFCELLFQQDIRVQFDRYFAEDALVPSTTTPYYGETAITLARGAASALDISYLEEKYPQFAEGRVFSVVLQSAMECKVSREVNAINALILKNEDAARVLTYADQMLSELSEQRVHIPSQSELKSGRLIDRVCSYFEETVFEQSISSGDLDVLSVNLYGGFLNVTFDTDKPIEWETLPKWSIRTEGKWQILTKQMHNRSETMVVSSPVLLCGRYQYRGHIRFFGSEKLFLERIFN